MKPQPFSVGVFSCPIAPVPACSRGFLRKPADFAGQPKWPFWAAFHSLLAIPRSDLAPWNWPKSAKATSQRHTDQRVTRGRIELLDCGIGCRRKQIRSDDSSASARTAVSF
jgi:hypothetical protein